MQEMLAAAEAHEHAQLARVSRHAQDDEARESTGPSAGQPTFLATVRQHAAGGEGGDGASVADAVRRRQHYIQRSSAELL